MTRHDDALLWEYAARELDEGDALQVELHLEDCARCREQLASVQVAREALEASRGALPLVSWDGVDLVVGGAVERRLNQRPKRWWWSWKVSSGLVAAAAVALALLWPPALEAPTSPPPVVEAPPAPSVARVAMASGLERLGTHPAVMHDGSPLEAGDVVMTTRGGRALVHLPDASAVRLAGATKLRLNRLEVDDVALELEQGRVAIRASHVDRKGFVVSAGGLFIHVVGTVFEVSSSKALTDVAVSEGRVRVELPDGERELVSAGQRLTVDGLGRLARANAIAPAVKRELDEVAGFGDPDRPSEPLSAVAPAAGGVRVEPPLVSAPPPPPPPRALPRLDPRQARARQGRLPDEVLKAPPPAEVAPSVTPAVAEAPVTQRLEPRTELVVEVPERASAPPVVAESPGAPAQSPVAEPEWALPPTATARRESRGVERAAAELDGEWVAFSPGGGVAPAARPSLDEVEVKGGVPVPATSPAVLRRPGKLGGEPNAGRPLAQDLESIFMDRAEAALDQGGCGRFLLGLEDIAQDEQRNPKSEWARVLRARCFDLELRPRQAVNEFRKYLEEYPRGRFTVEAREAVGAR